MSSYIQQIIDNDEKLNKIIDEAFASVGKQENDSITEEELEKILVQITCDMGAEPPTKEDIKEVMEVLDDDRSNSIEKKEFGKLIKNILQALVE